jgi:hypothetical protein
MRALFVLGLAVCAACTRAAPADGVTLTAPQTSAAPSSSAAHGSLLPRPDVPPPWQWDGPSPGHRRAPRTARDGALACTFTYDDKTFVARTACSSGGRELWRRDEPRTFDDDAALVLDHGTLYAARYPDISSGCTLHAIDARSGVERWKSALKALGPIAHSEYLNGVEVRMIHGRVVVFGWEIAARYIEGVDAATGATVYHVRLPPQPY